MYSNDDIEFTKEWWKKCCADPVKMARWLQKLQITEIEGGLDYDMLLNHTYEQQMAAPDQFVIDDRIRRVFANIGEDEHKHSGILLDLMADRKITPAAHGQTGTQSSYWTTMNKEIVDLDTYCAVNYLGEGLAAFRFEIIHEMACTPQDISNALDIILPDEQFHRQTLKRMTQDEMLERILQVHQHAFNLVRGIK
jgi:rubrerythrin